eukprot:7624445-Prorocentrum_lima.AAC.1
MTSSLVGSEMCIRDRWKCERDNDAHCPVSSLDAATVWATLLRPQLPTSCLLYTSDAADDM